MRRALEIPPKITPQGDDGYFEELTKAIFRAGLSSCQILSKFPSRLIADQSAAVAIP